MDILNSIWNVVTTPNQELINICFIFLIIFIDTPLTFSLICNIFKVKPTKKQKYIYIITVSILGILSMFVIKSPYNTILNYVSTFLILCFVLNMNIIKSLISCIFPSIVYNLLGNLLLNPYLEMFNLTCDQATTIPLYRIPFALFMYLIVFFFNLVLKYKNISINIIENVSKHNKSLITLNFFFGILSIIIQGVLTANYIDILPIQFTFFNFVCLFIYFGLSFFSIAKIMTLATTTQKLESVEAYNKSLHILHDSVRGFKHDFDNIVTTIGGYIKTNDMKGLENYYSQLVEDCQKVNNLYILNPDIVNNPGIYNLLTTKYNEAEEKGIKVNISFLLNLDNLNMKIYEFTRILGILLDNAIDAASECNEKILNIVFRDDSKNNRNIILIENTYNDKDVNLDEIFNKGFTGKENHSGLGLWEVRKILNNNNNNANLHTSKNEQYFSQQLEIYY